MHFVFLQFNLISQNIPLYCGAFFYFKAMFVPDLFGIIEEKLIETFPEVQEHDSEDLTDDRYLLEVC